MRLAPLFCLLFLTTCPPLFAADDAVDGTIHYVSRDLLYVSLGEDSGVAVGDTIQVVRDGLIITQAIVVHVAEATASARALQNDGILQIGDTVRFIPTTQSASDSQELVADAANTRVDTRPRTGSELLTPRPVSSGRVVTRMLGFHDASPEGYSALQPSLFVNWEGNRLAGQPLEWAITGRLRRDLGPGSNEGRFGSKGTPLTLYQGWVGWHTNERGAVSFQAGRIRSPLLSGVGLMDGGRVDIRPRSNWTLGLSGGYQPDLQSTELSTDGTRLAGEVRYKRGDWTHTRYEGGLALVQQSLNGSLDRRYLVHHSFLSTARAFQGWLGIEMDMNAADSATSSGVSQFTSGYFNARWRITRFTSWSVRANTIRFVKLLETHKSIPDSLWDDAQRYGVSSDVRFRLGRRWHVTVGGGFHQQEEVATPLITAFTRVHRIAPLWFDMIWGDARFLINAYVTSFALQLGGEKEIHRGWSGYGEVELYTFGYGDASPSYDLRTRFEGGLRWSPNRLWYATSSLTITTDPFAPYQQLFLEVGRRF
ncbi:hypothetical protein KQI63_12470 [bacterium]|nr:hypothetical protein [bacterium]